MNCLYIWRFQPFHIWHLDVINQIFDHGYQHVVLWVGSSNIKNNKNPRSYPERVSFINAWLEDRGLDLKRFSIVWIPDFTEDEDWLSYITSTIDFDCVMSGNSWVVDIFRSNDILVLDEIERIPIHAMDIRNMMQAGNTEEIQKWVTPQVYRQIIH